MESERERLRLKEIKETHEKPSTEYVHHIRW